MRADDSICAVALKNNGIQGANSDAGACGDLHHPSVAGILWRSLFHSREGEAAAKPSFWAGRAVCAARQLEPGAAGFTTPASAAAIGSSASTRAAVGVRRLLDLTLPGSDRRGSRGPVRSRSRDHRQGDLADHQHMAGDDLAPKSVKILSLAWILLKPLPPSAIARSSCVGIVRSSEMSCCAADVEADVGDLGSV
jgi:hypothetical protein